MRRRAASMLLRSCTALTNCGARQTHSAAVQCHCSTRRVLLQSVVIAQCNKQTRMVPQWAVRQLSSIITAASEKNSSETDINVPTTLGELNAVSMPEEVVENWFLLLRVLHNLGHFESKDTARELVIQSRNDVKTALLNFARARADVIFTLKPDDLVALAEAPLATDEEHSRDRKLNAAHSRLAATFLRNEHGPGGASHASTQDVLRVLWRWAMAPQPALVAQSQGFDRVIKSLLRQVAQAALSEPNPDHVEQAKKLGTPTSEELAVNKAGKKAKDSMDPQTLRKHVARLAAAASTSVLEVGDWFCAVCNTTNYRGRTTCIRCRMPVLGLGNTVVSQSDVTALYGSNPPVRDTTAKPVVPAENAQEAVEGAGLSWEEDDEAEGGRPKPKPRAFERGSRDGEGGEERHRGREFNRGTGRDRDWEGRGEERPRAREFSRGRGREEDEGRPYRGKEFSRPRGRDREGEDEERPLRGRDYSRHRGQDEDEYRPKPRESSRQRWSDRGEGYEEGPQPREVSRGRGEDAAEWDGEERGGGSHRRKQFSRDGEWGGRGREERGGLDREGRQRASYGRDRGHEEEGYGGGDRGGWGRERGGREVQQRGWEQREERGWGKREREPAHRGSRGYGGGEEGEDEGRGQEWRSRPERGGSRGAYRGDEGGSRGYDRYDRDGDRRARGGESGGSRRRDMTLDELLASGRGSKRGEEEAGGDDGSMGGSAAPRRTLRGAHAAGPGASKPGKSKKHDEIELLGGDDSYFDEAPKRREK